MSGHYRITFVSLGTLLLLACVMAPHAIAQESQFETEILPSQGSANTVILLRFNTLNSSIGGVEKADIFWDDSAVGLNVGGVLGADGSYNYNLTVPTEPPLSDIGNHTIRVDSSVSNYGQVTFNFTFTIVEFVPSPEYLVLNATYSSLLSNYTTLFDAYNLLLANYTQISADYATLTTQYDALLLNYNSLSANYNSLTANYNSLLANYNTLLSNYGNLTQTFGSLQTDYAGLQENFRSLNQSFYTLRNNFDSLSSNYSALRSDYENVVGQLAFDRNLNYIFITTTIILAISTLYFATRKSKLSSNHKTRY